MAEVEQVVLIVLDSVGIGALPDAAAYGDEGANTLGNLARRLGGIHLPNLGRLGLGNLLELPGVPPAGPRAEGAYGRMALRSPGKDTMTGHWELAGIDIREPFRTFPGGFPDDVIEAFCRRAGVDGVLGNRAASGTEIIAELGAEHLRTGRPIVYTSADSVFQVAAHEDVIPVERLYAMCQAAREILQGEYRVGRVIARPFTGAPGSFRRTERRRDFAVEPPPMLLDFLREAGRSVWAVGKIHDIYSGHGVDRSFKTRDNRHGLEVIETLLAGPGPDLIFANLVDFDTVYGHRRDVAGYARALAEVDAFLPRLLERLGDRSVLILTADHGNDPTFRGTDHTREYVPLLAAGAPVRAGADLGTRPTLADLGATVAALLGAPYRGLGESFAPRLLRAP